MDADPLEGVDYVELEVKVSGAENIRVETFSVNIRYINQNSTFTIDTGKICYDSDMKFYDGGKTLSIDINDTLKNYITYIPKARKDDGESIIRVTSEATSAINASDSFIIETHLDCLLDNRRVSANRVDTLFKRVVKSK